MSVNEKKDFFCGYPDLSEISHAYYYFFFFFGVFVSFLFHY